MNELSNKENKFNDRPICDMNVTSYILYRYQ